jgi:hypothetical protein
MARTRTINGFDELVDLVLTSDRPLYVRWTRASVARDLRLRRSFNNQSGLFEAGKSVNNLVPRLGWDSVMSPRAFVAQQLCEYSFLGSTCYLLTGNEIGTGGDNEPVLGDCQFVAVVGDQAIAEAMATDRVTGEICRHDGRRDVYAGRDGQQVVFCCKCNNRIS